MKWLALFSVLIISQSCVTRARYDKLVHTLESREKQKTKLENQFELLKQKQALLKDSADRIGG